MSAKSLPPRTLPDPDRGPRPTVAVVGAGLLGSLLALRLAADGFSVDLIDAAPRVGGLADSITIGNATWDRFYHVVLLSDSHTRTLLDELGLADRLHWGTTLTGFYCNGRLHSMSNALEFLRFPPLSLLDKLRLGGTIFLASRIRRPRPLEGMLAVDWLRRWSGQRVLDRIWLPLLRSKLGSNATQASAAFIWAIIARLYAARRSGLKEERFGYIDGGYALVNAALEQRLAAAGVRCHFGQPVTAIDCRQPAGADAARAAPIGPHATGARVPESAGFDVRLRDGRVITADRVICTVAPPLVARLVPALTDAERERLAGVTYQGILCAAIRLRHGLSRYYVTNITDGWVPFTGVIEMTTLVDRAHFDGDSLVYLPLYLPQDAEQWQWSDAEVRRRFLDALARMYPHFDRGDVVDFQVSRARQVLAVSTLDYSTRVMPPMTTSIPGLYCLNSAQIPYGTLNVNETLGLVSRHWRTLARAMVGAAGPKTTA